MKRILLPVALCGLLSLGACAAQPANTASTNPLAPVNTVVANLGKFTVADINAADKIAVTNNDAAGIQCYPVLAKFVQSLPSANGGQTVAGAVSAFEQARVLRMQITGIITGNDGGQLMNVRLACSALVMSEQQFLANLGILAAGGAVGAPALGAGATAIGGVLAAPFGG